MIVDHELVGTGCKHNAKRKVIDGGDATHSTVNLGEDNDVHFSSRPLICSDEVGQNSGRVLQDGGEVAETDEEILVVNVESRNPGSSVDVNASHTVTLL